MGYACPILILILMLKILPLPETKPIWLHKLLLMN